MYSLCRAPYLLHSGDGSREGWYAARGARQASFKGPGIQLGHADPRPVALHACLSLLPDTADGLDQAQQLVAAGWPAASSEAG